MLARIRHPSPAMVVAVIALFFALGGAAGAVTAVPLAKRAFSADNAKRLEKKNLAQVAAIPGPAIVSTTTSNVSLSPQQEGYVSVACEPGQRVISGGFSTTAALLGTDTYPQDDATWRIYLVNLTNAAATATLYAVCLEAPSTPPGTTFRRGGATGSEVAKSMRVGGRIG